VTRLRLRDGAVLAFEQHGPPRRDRAAPGSGAHAAESAVVLLHGFTGSRHAWRTDVVRALAAEHTLLLPDLIGHGESEPASRPERFALSEVVDDVCELLDARGIECAPWIGYSMGGRIALGAAVLRPERVSALVLEGASPGLASEADRAARRRSDGELAARIERDGIEAFVEFWTSQPLFATQRRLDPALRERQRALRLGQQPASLAACLRGLGTGTQPSLWDALEHVHVPTLVLAGAEDPKFVAIGEQMCARLPHAMRHIVLDAGHTTSLEQPEAYAKAVVDFLSGRAIARGAEALDA